MLSDNVHRLGTLFLLCSFRNFRVGVLGIWPECLDSDPLFVGVRQLLADEGILAPCVLLQYLHLQEEQGLLAKKHLHLVEEHGRAPLG